MTWGEAHRLVRVLRTDPSSCLAASLEGWDHGISRETLVMLDLFDLEHRKASKKTPDPHPMRPGKPQHKSERRGDRAGRDNAQVLALVRPASTESQSA